METYLGVDLGTSGLKGAVVAADGRVVAEAEAAYAVRAPAPGWAETDPQEWLAALDSALVALGPAIAGVRAAAVTGQMHGAVVVDEHGTALRPAVLWPDRRAVAQVARWRRLPEPVRARLANPLGPGMTGPILRWLLEHESATMTRAASVLLPKDYVRMSLGGTGGTDRSDASATLLWDVPADGWSLSTVDASGLPRTLLPGVSPSTADAGEVTAAGPLRGVPLVVGGADTPAALLAADLAPGEVQVNLGTGVQVLRPVAEPWVRADPPVHCYADCADGWYLMAAVQNGGLALDWVRRMFSLDWETFFAMAGRSSAPDLSFLPFLTGERGGVAPPSASGAWIGLTETTSRDQLVRSAVEGLAFCVRRCLELLTAEGAPVRLSGGGARSPVVRTLVAAAIGGPVRHDVGRSASATGAAMLAASGVGDRIARHPHAEPDPATHDRSPVSVAPPGRGAVLDDAYQLWLSRLASLSAQFDR